MALCETDALDYLARALEGAGRQVFCPDIAGRGKSRWLSNPADYNYAQYLTDMTALIARPDAESVDWVGTSMGGLIGMLLAAEANTPIRRLVINDAGPVLPLQRSSASAPMWDKVLFLTTSRESKNICARSTLRSAI